MNGRTFRLIALATGILVLLSGCTMQVSGNSAIQEGSDGKTALLPVDIQLQRIHSYPNGGSQLITASSMNAGDIILSSAAGPTSMGIRLFSISGVSHAAIYLGDDRVAEAVGSGVQIVSLEQAMQHSSKLIVFRYPGLTPEHALAIRQFSQDKVGIRYNYNGVALMAPFMLTRKVCDLNPFSSTFRNYCLNTLAKIQLGTDDDAKGTFFCSQFVLEAYKYAGYPITDSAPVWVSPADLLHMREGDVASLTPIKPLLYVGHLKQGMLETTTTSVQDFFSFN
ncbi:YaeF family permuted papain-like enzyme [Budvicia diplopodorum]|uniref:YaeF family permuted papain-like enzyme n=1 Tax=Budvicia diplopodorum TaxID=1119056 RepID=UPI001FE27F4B|nr:YaeF family permuted papain-like enzyme [Budvicia diplopodorum]